MLKLDFFPSMMIVMGFLFLGLVATMLVGFSYHNLETRQSNFDHLNSVKDCIQLKTIYSSSYNFEKEFDNNKDNLDKVNQIEQMKAKELNCN